MKDLLYISYYTEGYYEQIINKYLLPSLKKFNLNHHVEKFKNLRSWELNGKYKTTFITKMLHLTNNDIIFLDADAEILQSPDLFNDIIEDIGIHYLDWYKFWKNIDNKIRFDTLTGTLYIKNNIKTKAFMNEWDSVNQKSCQWAQTLFSDILKHYPEITINKLPIEYCQIIKQDNIIPITSVIVQHQASRKIRSKEEIL